MSAEFNQPEFNQGEFNDPTSGSGGVGPGSGDVFPTLGCIGYTARHEYRHLLRIYPDGSYRRRLRPMVNHKVVTIVMRGMPASVKDDVQAFFNDRKPDAGSGEDRFFFYNPEETLTLDLTGASTTGRHNAMFLDDRLEFTRDGRLTWSGSTRIFLFD